MELEARLIHLKQQAIEVLRKLWAGGMVEHRGEFFEFASLQMSPAPPAPLPILIGGVSRAALSAPRWAKCGAMWAR